MWRVLQSVGLALIAVCGVACSKGDSAGERLYQLPWPTASGDYKLQNVKITSFDHPEEMRGRYAKILVDPYIADGKLQSSEPVGRFAQVDSQISVPADFATLQATAIYAHLERLFQLDDAVGVAAKIQWPLTIALQANVVDQAGALVNNALYDGRLDALLIVPYFEARLPISLNAGILAHEHFHKIFQTMVLSQIQAKGGDVGRPAPAGAASRPSAFDVPCDWSVQADTDSHQRIQISEVKKDVPFDVPVQVYNEFLVRGLNEGLADFWGWVYTGDPSFIGRSLKPEETELRRMDLPLGRLPSVEVLKRNLKDPFSENGIKKEDSRYVLAYRLGTYYARFMRELALEIGGGDEKDLGARVAVAKALMNSLPMIAKGLVSNYTDDYISPNAMLKPLYLNLPSVNQAVCGLYNKFATEDDRSGKPVNCDGGRTDNSSGDTTVPSSTDDAAKGDGKGSKNGDVVVKTIPGKPAPKSKQESK